MGLQRWGYISLWFMILYTHCMYVVMLSDFIGGKNLRYYIPIACCDVIGLYRRGINTYIHTYICGKNLRYYIPIACCDVIGFYRRGMQ